ncbi:MAG TPA: CGNR zinc finger domain-containing protein [Bryobacteraceae bacterium]
MTKIRKPETQATSAGSAARRASRERPIPRTLVAHQAGGHLALDFCNTAGEHLADHPEELLSDWESFLRWATQVALIGPESYFELLTSPKPLDKIVQLREAIYRIGLAFALRRRVSKHDIEFIRDRAHVPRPNIEFRNNVGRWHPDPSNASEQLCGVLAGEALSLFCSPKAGRIGVCDGGKCGWLFLDESRGKRRRWCDMKDCGNRAKAQRHYEAHKRRSEQD